MSTISDKDFNVLARKELLARLMQLGQLSSNTTAHYHQMVGVKIGLQPQDTRALSVLMFEGQISAGQLAKEMGLTTGAITGLVDRLERKQLVERIIDKHDRRKVLLQLNPTGMQSIGRHYASMGQAAETLYGSYGTTALTVIADFLQRSLEVTRQEIKALQDTQTE